ncbi:MAG: DegT/DnrJ/EryC1/StrS family aminotransferase [Desulfarculus sp.]|nr:DegT/DnrJ/EryC1/StrS family aminotransferase [Desulfarculus sp.]
MSAPEFIPVCEPLLAGNEAAYVNDCVASGWISSAGDYLARFEQGMAALCQVGHGVACANGTAALHLACAALGLGPGDEVICPAFSIISTANSIVQTGATPVLVDVEPDTLCLDPALAARAVTPRTRAIMPVHMYGHPAEMDPIMDLARRHGLVVIEDAAQVHGGGYKQKPLGGIGQMGCFSFFANKLITTGEGGMVVTDDPELARRLRLLRNLAHGPRRFEHHELGFNYRLTNLQAALGLAQLERLEATKARKAAIGDRYNQNLADLPGITLYWGRHRPSAQPVMWMYGLLLPPEIDRAAAMDWLRERGVDSRAFFLPLNQQPMYDGSRPGLPDLRGCHPVSEDAGRRGLYLPSGVGLSDEQVDRASQALRDLVLRG